jgi:hypothetical protein
MRIVEVNRFVRIVMGSRYMRIVMASKYVRIALVNRFTRIIVAKVFAAPVVGLSGGGLSLTHSFSQSLAEEDAGAARRRRELDQSASRCGSKLAV